MARVMERRTRIGLAGVVAVAGGLTLPMLATRTFAAAPSPPFTQCPALGVDTSCGTLIVINADGSLTIVSDLSQRPIDGRDDTLLGVVNNSAAAVPNLRLSSTTLKIFGFEGDGICAYRFTGNGYSATRPRGSTGYEGPDIVFSNISGDQKSGTLNFTEPDGAFRRALRPTSAWKTLSKHRISSSSLRPPCSRSRTHQPPPVTSRTQPSSQQR
jgi:hypothetical protein